MHSSGLSPSDQKESREADHAPSPLRQGPPRLPGIEKFSAVWSEATGSEEGEADHAPSPLRQEPPRLSGIETFSAVWSEATGSEACEAGSRAERADTGASEVTGH
jgi:hypothetical protein